MTYECRVGGGVITSYSAASGRSRWFGLPPFAVEGKGGEVRIRHLAGQHVGPGLAKVEDAGNGWLHKGLAAT